MPPPPPPPPPAPVPSSSSAPPPQVPRPVVPSKGPPGALLLHLVVYSGGSFKNHWCFFIRSQHDPNLGNIIHVIGDVKNGFEFQVKRNHNFNLTPNLPIHNIPLQWVDGRYFNEAMFNGGRRGADDKAVCDFERSVCKIKPPTGSLNSAKAGAPKTRVVQRNCQTWLLEASDQLVADGVMHPDIAAYLYAIKQ